jgi:hypothetical protein
VLVAAASELVARHVLDQLVLGGEPPIALGENGRETVVGERFAGK